MFSIYIIYVVHIIKHTLIPPNRHFTYIMLMLSLLLCWISYVIRCTLAFPCVRISWHCTTRAIYQGLFCSCHCCSLNLSPPFRLESLGWDGRAAIRHQFVKPEHVFANVANRTANLLCGNYINLVMSNNMFCEKSAANNYNLSAEVTFCPHPQIIKFLGNDSAAILFLHTPISYT